MVVVVVVVVLDLVRNLPLGRKRVLVFLRLAASPLAGTEGAAVGLLSTLVVLPTEALGGGGLLRMLATTSKRWLWAGVARKRDLGGEAVEGLGASFVVDVVELWEPNLCLAANLLLNTTVLAVGLCGVGVVVLGASVYA